MLTNVFQLTNPLKSQEYYLHTCVDKHIYFRAHLKSVTCTYAPKWWLLKHIQKWPQTIHYHNILQWSLIPHHVVCGWRVVCVWLLSSPCSRCLPGYISSPDWRHDIWDCIFRRPLLFFLIPGFFHSSNYFDLIHLCFLPSSLIPFCTFCSSFHIPSHLHKSVLFISSESRGSLVHASHRNQFQLRQHNQTKHYTHFSTGRVVTHLSHFLPPAPLLEDILFSLWCHYVNHCRHVVMCGCSC